MGVKEKAKELVEKYYGITDVNWGIRQQKQCALIAVGEIRSLMVKFHGRYINNNIGVIEY